MADETPKPSWYRNEDWLTVCLGFLLIAVVLAGQAAFGYKPTMPSFDWATSAEFKAAVVGDAALHAKLDALAADAEAKGEEAVAGAAKRLKEAAVGNDRAGAEKAAQELRGASKKAKDKGLAKKADGAGKSVLGTARSVRALFVPSNLLNALQIAVLYLVLGGIGVALLGGSALRFAAGFPVVFLLTWLAQVIAGNYTVGYLGLEYVIFALGIGLLVGNLLPIPAWLQEAVRTEFYIKTGLVMMGAGILFKEILRAGLPGIVQALVVVIAVWYIAFWLAKKLRLDDEFSAMIASSVSICGVSAAIATCGAVQGDKKKLSYITSLVLICAVPMMVGMPWIVKATGISDRVGGAWMGGTIDTTGAVVAAGALLGDEGLTTSTVVKFSQNVLIGIAAFILAAWWSLKRGGANPDRPRLSLIWERFPKFVLGFAIASLVFSFLLDPAFVASVKGSLKGLQVFWFGLAFTSIGLETRFGELFKLEGGRPATAFLVAQAFNILWTLLIAWLLFGVICTGSAGP